MWSQWYKWVEMTDDKHSSLLLYGINYCYKEFYSKGPSVVNDIKLTMGPNKLDCLKV
jgi:hypothetical protein